MAGRVAGVGLVTVLAFAACGGDDDSGSGSGSGSGTSDGAVALAAAESDQPFAEPPRQQSENGVLAFDLVASNRGITVAGSDVKGRAYNDGIVGPTLVVNPGDTIALTLDNQLDAHTNIHFHGMHVSPRDNSDNIFFSVEPGEQFAYSLAIPDDHPSGTFWYHSHAHGISEEQVFGGLSGMIIVKASPTCSPRTARHHRHRDRAQGRAGRRRRDRGGANIDSNAPTLRVVNSAHLPVPGDRPRRSAAVAPREHRRRHLVRRRARDRRVHGRRRGRQPRVGGVGCRSTSSCRRASGSTCSSPARPPATTCSRPASTTRAATSIPRPISCCSRRRAPRSRRRRCPRRSSSPAAIQKATSSSAARWSFSETRTRTTSSSTTRSSTPTASTCSRSSARSRSGRSQNTSDEQHPFHIHVNDFEVISIDGEPYAANGLQDTVPLIPGQDVVIRTRFTDFTGKFVFHCHILNHEDNGMMAVVEVVE